VQGEKARDTDHEHKIHSEWGSLQACYRCVYMDYETGSGTSQFKYDVLSQGAQIGFTFHF